MRRDAGVDTGRAGSRPAVPMLAVAVVALLLASGAATRPVAAQERIRAYDIDVDIRDDGSLIVTERITVRAEGSQIRRGIYRDFPTRYRDRYGNRVVVDLQVLGVERNGQPEAWFTERVSNGIRINTGGDDYLPGLPGNYTFTLRYRTTRQLGFFAEHDELYWNAIGTGWVFPIEGGTVTVRLPQPVPAAQLHVEAYTGPQGARGTAYEAAVAGPGVATYRLTAPLQPHEGFTIVLTFPKGLIPPPTSAQRTTWLLRDNAGLLVALAGMITLLAFTITAWSRVGRDPQPGTIIPRYSPPTGHSPAALRYVQRMDYDTRCFSADLIALAVAGQLRIHRQKKWKPKWKLERTSSSAPVAAGAAATAADGRSRLTATLEVQPAQRTLLAGLFPGGRTELELTDRQAAIVAAARDLHRKSLGSALQPRYFQRHHGRVVGALLIGIATAAAAFGVSGGAGVPAIIVVLVAMVFVIITFSRLVRAPTTEGRRLLDEIAGFRLYLSVAERDELAGVAAPDAPPRLDAGRYEALLPYAVALQVEDAWTRKFTAAVGAAAAAETAQRIHWYSGGRVTDLGDFSRSIGSSLTSTIASASTPPGSSSGSGGGGSSGGGGGGGGGGGR